MNIEPYIFKGADSIKNNGFNRFLTFHKESYCPVPPPMSTYQ